MSLQNEIVDFVIQEFSFLETKYNFNKPVIDDANWHTTNVDFIEKKIAIEINLDFREIDVLILLVMLENGKLPKGYYISKRKRVRKYLLQIIKDKKWDIDKTILNEFNELSKNITADKILFQRKIVLYKKIISLTVDDLLKYGKDLFE